MSVRERREFFDAIDWAEAELRRIGLDAYELYLCLDQMKSEKKIARVMDAMERLKRLKQKRTQKLSGRIEKLIPKTGRARPRT